MAERDIGGGEAPPRLPLAEAAARMGKSVDAVRAMIRRRQLTATKGNDGRLLVAVPSDLAQASDEPGLGVDDAVLEQLRGELAEALAEAEHWRSLAHEHELAHARAEGERDAAQLVAAAELAGRDALIAELRRSWVDRVTALFRR